MSKGGSATKTLFMRGDKADPEKPYYRIIFPGGCVYVARTSDDEYWAHISVNHKQATAFDPTQPAGRLCDARIDVTDKHAADVVWADFESPNLYHVAVKVKLEP